MEIRLLGLVEQARRNHMPCILLDRYEPEAAALSLISEETARRFHVFPLFMLKDKVYLATAEADELAAADFVGHLTRLSVDLVLAHADDVEAAINRHYLSQERAAHRMQKYAAPQPDVTTAGESGYTVRLEDSEAPAINLIHYILTQAVKLRASDVHLEAFEDATMLRYRIDGVLHEFPPPPLHLFRALVSRVKIISNLDIAERRLPQDGRSDIEVEGTTYDLRISIIPNLHGEGVVIRLLDRRGSQRQLTELGWSPQLLAQYQRLISQPYGILLVTGPTGSGKSTTLYSTLMHIYTPRRKMITLEDPVEYQIRGVTQIPVQPDIGFTFASGLRAVLRHDPDVVMIGEIRDSETADIAIRASLTGHLVFSTLHTNDAASTVVRLTDMGVQPFLVFSSLLGVLAQRLVRRLCMECRRPLSPSELEEAARALGLAALPAAATVYEARGCESCNQLGYLGRIAIHELLEITPALQRLLQGQAAPDRIRDILSGFGQVEREGAPPYRTLRQSATEKMCDGVTAMEEVLSVTRDSERGRP